MTPDEPKNDEVEETPAEEPKPKRSRKKAAPKAAAAPTPDAEATETEKPKRTRRKATPKAEADEAAAAEAPAEDEVEAKPKRRRTKTAEPAAEEVAATDEAAADEVVAAEEPVAEAAADEVVAPDEPAEEAEADEVEPVEPAARPARRNGRAAEPVVLVHAQAKYVRTSARKARLVCDHIRGKDVAEARAILAFTPREAAKAWTKLLESAVANAEHNHELVGDELRIYSVHADEGPTLKRFRPRAMGRATRIRKRTSHLTITLTPKES
jgi:ribosomal protein L22